MFMCSVCPLIVENGQSLNHSSQMKTNVVYTKTPSVTLVVCGRIEKDRMLPGVEKRS